MNKDLLKSFIFTLTGATEYSINLSNFTNTDDLFLLFVKQELDETLLIPTNMYSVDVAQSKINITMAQTEYQYAMICERPKLVSFNWNALTSLTDLQFTQLNELYNNFKDLSKEVKNMFETGNFALLTNNIDKARYVFPKLKTGEVFMMDTNGLISFDLKAIYDEYEAKFVQFTTLLEGYKQNVLDQEIIVGTQRETINQQINHTQEQADLLDEILQTLNSLSIGDLTQLTTVEKGNLVGAINEINANKLEKGTYTGNAENLSYHSAGIVSLPIITKETNGNITLDSTGIIIFGVNGVYIKKTNITGTTLIPLDDTASFIYADYQTGTPAYKIGVDNTIFLSDTTKVPVLRVSRKGTTLHLSKYGETGVNSLEKLMLKDVFLRGFERESGLVLSTSATRKASVSNGVAWFSEKRYILPENLNGTSGIMYEYYLVSGVWTKSAALSLYDSTYYSDGTNRLTLTANRYVAKYFYRDIGDDNEIYYTHGNQYTTLANALAESVPVAPTELTNHSMYVGKIIIQQGATNGTAYPRAWGETLNNTNIQNHDDLANIKQATIGITNGHISDVAQDIYGVKTFKNGVILESTSTAPTGTTGSTTKQIATNEFATNQDLGVGQTWQDVTSNRTVGTTYTNTTGKPIMIGIRLNANSNISTELNGVPFGYLLDTGTSSGGYSFIIIPPGMTYKFTSLSGSIYKWIELR